MAIIRYCTYDGELSYQPGVVASSAEFMLIGEPAYQAWLDMAQREGKTLTVNRTISDGTLVINVIGLPTSDPGVVGDVYADSNVLTVSA
jgi:hypothetical protein